MRSVFHQIGCIRSLDPSSGNEHILMAGNVSDEDVSLRRKVFRSVAQRRSCSRFPPHNWLHPHLPTYDDHSQYMMSPVIWTSKTAIPPFRA